MPTASLLSLTAQIVEEGPSMNDCLPAGASIINSTSCSLPTICSKELTVSGFWRQAQPLANEEASLTKPKIDIPHDLPALSRDTI